ncbi:glucose dehydrogenase [FAD, quinone] [Ptiloglossa arizonensis]|uniref:glucose dehydrogenase [FAD, quinone] n=1 Tax=Ptiloglossa arizonensis TaxID=3350558 RepID=UPI003F9F026C
MACVFDSMRGETCPNPYVGEIGLTDVCSANSKILFLTLLNSLMVANKKISQSCNRVPTIEQPAENYDAIIVGAGAAGPVIANRLSEMANWSVLLVEAGPDEPGPAETPSFLQLFLGTKLDWQYHTSNESFACLGSKASCYWPRGKNLGGNTVHHGMAYHRGHAKDYERWVAMGNKGWSWEEVLKYFKKSENNKEIGRVGRKWHATGGPMTVERFPWRPEFSKSIMEAAKEAGFGVTEDLVGDRITGFTVAQTISEAGVRRSSTASFLYPIRNRSNLSVLVNAYVTKIHIKNKQATGVELYLNGKKYDVKASREVIVSGGTINSPQLLLLSGIGPREHLESVNIKVVHNLPGVGENLHNHQSYGVDFITNEKYKDLLNEKNVNEYLKRQTGPLSGTGLAQVTGILASEFTTADDPDTQIFFAGYQAICKTKTKIADLTTYDDKMTVRFSAVNVQPDSRGRITLKSNDPFEHPYIWSNDLASERDLEIVYFGLRSIFKMANTTAMRKRGLQLRHKPLPLCSSFGVNTEAYWKCAIRWDTRPENHQSGTCKMGPASDKMAVVDPQSLSVYGIKGLRVADASVMPMVISGNPVAVINMIGERAADFIKRDWGFPN